MCANIRNLTIRNILRAAIGSVWVVTCMVFTMRSLYLIQELIDSLKQQFLTSPLTQTLEISASAHSTPFIFGIRPMFLISGSIALTLAFVASSPVLLQWPGRKFVTYMFQLCGGVFSGSLAYCIFFDLVNYNFELGSLEIKNISVWESVALSMFVGSLTFYVIYVILERWRER
jgi:hypothetical protein